MSWSNGSGRPAAMLRMLCAWLASLGMNWLHLGHRRWKLYTTHAYTRVVKLRQRTYTCVMKNKQQYKWYLGTL